MRLFKLEETVFTVKGDASSFLKGISANTLDAPMNAFLNQHGRIIATFRQKPLSADEFLISVPNVAVENLLKHLERYIKLSHVSLIKSDLQTYINLDTGMIFFDRNDFPNSVTEEEFTLYRLQHHIPLMGVDYQADEFLLNVHEFDYVSYTKGCFLGQEPVAKVHNRSRPSRKMTVTFKDQCSPDEAVKMTSQVLDPVSHRIKGFLFVANQAG